MALAAQMHTTPRGQSRMANWGQLTQQALAPKLRLLDDAALQG